MTNKTYELATYDEYGNTQGNTTQFTVSNPTCCRCMIKSGNNYVFTDNTADIYTSTTLLASSWTKRFTNTSSKTSQYPSLRKGSDGYLYFGCRNLISGTEYYVIYKSTDDGVTWSEHGKVTASAGYAVDEFCGMFEIGGNWYILVSDTYGGAYYYYAVYNMTTLAISGLHWFKISTVVRLDGFVHNDEYYFMLYDGAAFYLYSHDGSSLTSIRSYTNANLAISGSVHSYEIFRKRNNIVFFTSGDYTRSHILVEFATSSTVVNSLLATKGGATNIQCSPIAAEDDNYDLQYVATSTAYRGPVTIWKVLRSGFVVLDQPPFTLNAGSGLLNWGIGDFIDVSNVMIQRTVKPGKIAAANHPCTFSDFDPKNVVFYSDQLSGNKISFLIDQDDDFEIIDGEYVEIYETTADPDERVVLGYVDIEKSEPADGNYTIVDGAEKDFSKKVSVSWTADKSHEMLQDLIDDECDFLEGTISDDSFSDWAYSAKDVEIRKVIQDIMNHDAHMFIHDAADQCDFISDPLSGAAVLSCDIDNIGRIDLKKILYPATEVRLTGKWDPDSNDYLRSVWRSSEASLPSQHILTDAFPYIDSQTDLDDMAERIGTMRKNQLYEVRMEVQGNNDLLTYGSVIEICYPLLGIGTENADYTPLTYDNYIISRIAQNEDGYLYIEAISAFVFTRGRESKPKSLTDTHKIATQANERIEKLAETLSPNSHVPVTIGTANGLSLATQTLSMAAGTTAVVGAVQLTDSVASTSTSTAATPNAVKTAYDLAAGKIANVVEDTNPQLGGDLDSDGNDILIKDNTANAFVIKEGANSYLDFTTTNGSEKITAGKELAMGTNKITGVGDPTAAQDAVTRNWIATAIYPVGSIYISTLSTNPATLLGFGTWATFAAGRVLVGLDSGDTSFDTVEETGGAKTHTLSVAEMPAHYHSLSRAKDAASGTSKTTIQDAGAYVRDTDTKGSGSAHNNLQPYIVVYMWKRTA